MKYICSPSRWPGAPPRRGPPTPDPGQTAGYPHGRHKPGSRTDRACTTARKGGLQAPGLPSEHVAPYPVGVVSHTLVGSNCPSAGTYTALCT